eukprot:3940905-Rhodomonas_salina.1
MELAQDIRLAACLAGCLSLSQLETSQNILSPGRLGERMSTGGGRQERRERRQGRGVLGGGRVKRPSKCSTLSFGNRGGSALRLATSSFVRRSDSDSESNGFKFI